jgi:hypothetical protein
LLTAAEATGFSVIVTVDQSIQFQQNMSGRRLSIVYLRAPKNDMPTLAPLAEMVMAQLGSLQARTTVILSHPDWPAV